MVSVEEVKDSSVVDTSFVVVASKTVELVEDDSGALLSEDEVESVEDDSV